MRASVGALLAALHTGLSVAAAPYESTYVPLPTETTLIQGVALFTGDGNALDRADVLLKDGRIAAITEGGATLAEPASGRVIDGNGKWLTPGIIDVHSHLGTYPSPSVASTADG
ncbi:MAG: amidohydrolase, partial [Gammaproteobacteria bacterium]|nr:amidohydrolase [Gammaproteobacteria bacterium]